MMQDKHNFIYQKVQVGVYPYGQSSLVRMTNPTHTVFSSLIICVFSLVNSQL